VLQYYMPAAQRDIVEQVCVASRRSIRYRFAS
jgi:hypothetical protein